MKNTLTILQSIYVSCKECTWVSRVANSDMLRYVTFECNIFILVQKSMSWVFFIKNSMYVGSYIPCLSVPLHLNVDIFSCSHILNETFLWLSLLRMYFQWKKHLWCSFPAEIFTDQSWSIWSILELLDKLFIFKFVLILQHNIFSLSSK